MDKQELALAIFRLDLQLKAYIEMLNGDGIMHQLFPQMWEELQDPMKHRPQGDIRTKYQDRPFVQKLLEFFEKYNKHLIKDVRVERHDHHGLHLILEEAVELTRQLLNSTASSKIKTSTKKKLSGKKAMPIRGFLYFWKKRKSFPGGFKALQFLKK